ncbi:hypothetical protein [Azospirillum doebereinerae]
MVSQWHPRHAAQHRKQTKRPAEGLRWALSGKLLRRNIDVCVKKASAVPFGLARNSGMEPCVPASYIGGDEPPRFRFAPAAAFARRPAPAGTGRRRPRAGGRTLRWPGRRPSRRGRLRPRRSPAGGGAARGENPL